MKYLLFLVGLFWSGVAFAQATAQAPNALGNVTTPALTDQIPVCQTVGGCDLSLTKPLKNETAQQLLSLGACPSGTTCVAPTGVAATDTAAIQAAVNTDYAVVQLLPGTFVTNADITITHRNVNIKGLGATWGAGLPGSVPPYPSNTNVDCSAIPHASSNIGGCFVVNALNTHFSGFRIFSNASSGENCIAVGDSGTIIDGGMVLDNCYAGVVIDSSIGSTSGYTLNTFINHTYIDYAYQFGIYCNSSCSDYMFGPMIWTEVNGINYTGSGGLVNLAAAIYIGPNGVHGRTFGNFLGDGATCMVDNGALDIAFVNNECGNSVLAVIANASSLQFVGNSGYLNGSTADFAIQIGGSVSSDVQITNNFFEYGYGACFQVQSAGNISNATIANNHCTAPQAMYADAHTNAVIDQYVNPHPNGGQTVANTAGTFAAPDWQSGFDITLPLSHGANTLPNPVYTSFGQKGTATITQSAGGSDTIVTLGSAYVNAPASLSTTAYATDIYPWMTNSGGNIIFGAKTASLTPNANLLTGGNAMTTGWTNVALTSFTTNSVADPIATTTAAKALETTANTNHGVQQTLSGMSASTTYTCAVWFNQGTGLGTRNMAFYVTDASSNNGYVVLGQDGSQLGISGVGIVGAGVYGTATGGWSRLYAQINTTAAPATLNLYLYNGTSITYAGTVTSGGEFWGPTCRLGVSP